VLRDQQQALATLQAKHMGVEQERTCGCLGMRHGMQDKGAVKEVGETIASSGVGHQ